MSGPRFPAEKLSEKLWTKTAASPRSRELRKSRKISAAFPHRYPQFHIAVNCYTFETFADDSKNFRTDPLPPPPTKQPLGF
jgi:hypothetical protein